jgi:hypothetical protein
MPQIDNFRDADFKSLSEPGNDNPANDSHVPIVLSASAIISSNIVVE